MKMLGQTFDAFSKYYEQLGDYHRSLDYYRKFNRIKDSLFTIEAEERIAVAELRYESEKKEAEISRLTGDAALQKLQVQKHRQSRNIFLFSTLLVLLLALLLFVRYRLKTRLALLLKQKNDELTEKEVQISRQKNKIERQYQKLSELDEAKTRFFANISHEFRTPLTLVQGPVDDVLGSDDEKLSENATQKLRLARRNLGQLKTLTEQLLDLSKLKAGKLKLRTQRQDLVPYLNRTVNSFQSAIPVNKRIEFVFSSNVEALHIYFDTEKLDRIINNLVSNAIKAIESSGTIQLKLIAPDRDKEEENSFVKIEIEDNGCGISEKDLSLIFNRFFRGDDSGLNSNTGTGIGLELTRELVELHGGSIEAESELGKGSKFTFQLPMGSDHLEGVEMTGTAEVENPENITWKLTEDLPDETIPVSHEFTLLVVEDHPDMLDYITENLSRHFTVITAANGIEALEKINRQIPNMIVSDLMMPGMDGMGLLTHVRDHKPISDVPFILLTARADDEDRVAGYQMKADAYITKPFNTNELLIRIKSLLETRQDIKQKYAKKVLSITFDREGLTSADKQFLDKMKQVVIQNLSDHHFGMPELASAAFLSERQLRRKLTELTGLPPVEFIRQIRLQQAKVLLEENVYSTVSEVSAAVGFNNPAYFSRLFSKMFGQAPQELMKSVLQ
jgi:signal transduction histidine kinase/DNA-binding response OmpR family regulator